MPNNKKKNRTSRVNSAKPAAKKQTARHNARTAAVKHAPSHKAAHPSRAPARGAKGSKAPAKAAKAQETQPVQQNDAEELRRAAEMLENRNFVQHINSKVSSSASDILRILAKNPRTDDDIASRLDMKVNDVRRALNIMNSYGIVKYDVNKDNKGWLIFKWKLNQEKLDDYVTNIETEPKTPNEPDLPGNCNDFFVCRKCYTSQKIVLPFDSAFESGFNCDSCGKPYAILNRQEAVELFKTQDL